MAFSNVYPLRMICLTNASYLLRLLRDCTKCCLSFLVFGPGRVQARIATLGRHILVPDVDNYIQGALDQQRHLRAGHPSFFMGRYSLHGWWYYYPVAFLIKTPLPILLLVIFRLSRLKAVSMATGEYVVVLPVIGMMLLACFDTVDLGLRNILPLYPFLFVWLSRIVALEVRGGGRAADQAQETP